MNEDSTNNFIHEIIESDLSSKKIDSVKTRFPPEPNGYLHLGHAKAIHLDFETAKKYNGECNLRFDDTNPLAEDEKFVAAIQKDIKWLGYDWGKNIFWASNYFDQMYDYALKLIQQNDAYVCDLSIDQFKEYRGVPTKPGKLPPGRKRSIEENISLFKKMKAGGFDDGSYVLRAKIDMSSPNLHLRDPAIYRIRHTSHHNTKNKYCIYPMYDFAHCIEDSIEEITHSLCTLEFEVHRPLYDWIINKLDIYKPQQIEFSRLNMSYMIMSKRRLLQLIENDFVNDWDDPRLPTISGLRRRGYTANSIKKLCEAVGCTKYESITEIELFENFVRSDLNETSPRAMAVLDPIKLIIENYPKDKVEYIDISNHPQDPSFGSRKVPFSKELYIERNDYMDNAPNKFKRFTIGREVRLRSAYCVTCTNVLKDDNGNVNTVICTYDPSTKGVNPSDGRKVRGIVHWVSIAQSFDAEIRLYERLFKCENPAAVFDDDIKEIINTNSLKIINAKIEPSLKEIFTGDRFQFERIGYFCADDDYTIEKPIFNQTINLRGKK